MTNKELLESLYEHQHQGDVLLGAHRLEQALKLLENLNSVTPTKKVADLLAADSEPVTFREIGPKIV